MKTDKTNERPPPRVRELPLLLPPPHLQHGFFSEHLSHYPGTLRNAPERLVSSQLCPVFWTPPEVCAKEAFLQSDGHGDGSRSGRLVMQQPLLHRGNHKLTAKWDQKLPPPREKQQTFLFGKWISKWKWDGGDWWRQEGSALQGGGIFPTEARLWWRVCSRSWIRLSDVPVRKFLLGGFTLTLNQKTCFVRKTEEFGRFSGWDESCLAPSSRTGSN